MKSRLDAGAMKELSFYSDEVASTLRVADDKHFLFDLVSAIVDLSEANAKIWGLEAAIRNEFPADPAASCKPLDFAEIGKRAVAIREHNRDRLEAKKKIDAIFGDISDAKIDHLSSPASSKL